MNSNIQTLTNYSLAIGLIFIGISKILTLSFQISPEFFNPFYLVLKKNINYYQLIAYQLNFDSTFILIISQIFEQSFILDLVFENKQIIRLFGIAFILTELDNKSFIQYCLFLKKPLGRGLFNIFISSHVFGYCVKNDYSIGAIIALAEVILLIFSGTLHIIFYCRQTNHPYDVNLLNPQEQTK